MKQLVINLVLLRQAIAVVQSTLVRGNYPFGATLVDAAGNVILSAENTVNTENDCTGHAEMNLICMARAGSAARN